MAEVEGSGSIARQWVVANIVAATAGAVLALPQPSLRTALGVDVTDPPLASTAAFIAAEAGTAALEMALFAWLTGMVLRRIVPALSQSRWLAIHVAIGIVGGLVSGFSTIGPDSDEPYAWDDTRVVILAVFFFAIVGALLGAAIGGLQAAVLRQAAEGTRMWVAMSAAAVCMLALLVLATLPFMSTPPAPAEETASTFAVAVFEVTGACIMLFALRRLRPRAA